MNFSLILTHPGGSHKDEFLACCLLLARDAVPIVRREPDDADLADPAIAVMDVGGEHAPARGNFDHHQFPKDHPPICALSLVLQHLGGLRGCADVLRLVGARRVAGHPRRGGNVALAGHRPRDIGEAQLAGGRDVAAALRGRFPAGAGRAAVGGDALDRCGPADLFEKPSRAPRFHWQGGGVLGNPICGRAVSRAVHAAHRAVARANRRPGWAALSKATRRGKQVVGMVYPDRRGPGFGLSRHNDHPRLDFTRIQDCEDVHFAHARGFVAKTSATDPQRLRELIGRAWA